MTIVTDNYPNWACQPCGNKHGSKKNQTTNWHYGKCEVCNKNAPVTPPKDFGHFQNWFK